MGRIAVLQAQQEDRVHKIKEHKVRTQNQQQQQQGQQNQQQVYSGAEITGTYRNGDSSVEVKQAQILLNRTACQIGPAGSAGSAGNETEYFGSKTTTAIRCYQGLRGLTVNGTLTPSLYTALVGEVGAAPAITVEQQNSGSSSNNSAQTTTPPAGTQTGNQNQGSTQTGNQSQTNNSQQTTETNKKPPVNGVQGQGSNNQQGNNTINDGGGYVPIGNNPVYRSQGPANRGAPPAL